MEHEVPNFEPQEPSENPKKRWAFLRRGSKKTAETEHAPLADDSKETPRPSASRSFAGRLADLLSSNQPESAPPPLDLPSPETPETPLEDVEQIVSRRRKWGESVLNMVASTARRVKHGPKSPDRSTNETVLGEAAADMEDAQVKLSETENSGWNEQTVENPDLAGVVKREVKRTFRSIKAERERLKQADPPSEMAQMLTLGVLALFGGGLFMSAWQEQKVKKVTRKLAEQEKVIEKQEVKMQKLEQKVEAQTSSPDRELVRRIGAFTHEQAAITREVAQEVREYRTLIQETKRPMQESPLKTPEAVPTQANPETLPYSALLDQQDQTQAQQPPDATHTSSSPPLAPQSSTTPDQSKQKLAKKVPPKDPAANYALVFVTIAFGLAVWFIFFR